MDLILRTLNASSSVLSSPIYIESTSSLLFSPTQEFVCHFQSGLLNHLDALCTTKFVLSFQKEVYYQEIQAEIQLLFPCSSQLQGGPLIPRK